MDCSNCGEPISHRVWESRTLHEKGAPPKFVGCENCGTMDRFSGRRV